MLEDLVPVGKAGEVGCRVPLREGPLIYPNMALNRLGMYIGTWIPKDYTLKQSNSERQN